MTIVNSASSNISGFGVFKAINLVQSSLSKTGIQKTQQNQQQRYNFRGIDDIYNALAPKLAEHGLCIMPTVLDREVSEVVTQRGGKMYHVTLKVKLDFISSEDGSCKSIEVYGEAMDSGDKATNKAMTAAYKVACFQVFCIPTEGENDADHQTHEIVNQQPQPQPQPQQQQQQYNQQAHDNRRQAQTPTQQHYKAVADGVREQYQQNRQQTKQPPATKPINQRTIEAPAGMAEIKPVIVPIQVRQLQVAMQMAGIDDKTFCNMAKIRQLGSLTQDRFEGAMRTLKKEAQRTVN